ncbi:hypothetical protein F5X99DRAFT_172362 [Biscogniauxia marginata]|nr:hypothetical protein F5X99DRAFT_172362 [Biscogniauxia marginata]
MRPHREDLDTAANVGTIRGSTGGHSQINREIGNSARPESWGRQPVTALGQARKAQAPSQLQASQSHTHTPSPSGLGRQPQLPSHRQQHQTPQSHLHLHLQKSSILSPSRRANTSQSSPSPPASSPSLLSSSSSSSSSSTITASASELPHHLPPLSPSLSSCISPLDPLASHDGNHSFTWTQPEPTPTAAHPAGAAAPFPASRHYHFPSANANAHAYAASHSPPPADDLIISPISETPSSTLPVFRNLNHLEGPSASTTSTAAAAAIPDHSSHGLVPAPAPVPVPASISNLSPTRDPLFGITPLLEEAGFDFEPHSDTGNLDHAVGSASTSTSASASASRSPPAPTPAPASAAVSHAVAHDVAHLTTDDNRSDDWFRYTAKNSNNPKYTNSTGDPHRTMTVPMAADRADMPDQQQQANSGSSSSFTPLPPIRRTSTFDLLRKKGLVVDDDSDSAPSPVEKDVPPAHSMQGEMAHQNGHGNGQLSVDQGQSSPHSSGQQLPHQPQPPSQNNQGYQSHPMQQPPPNGLAAPGQSAAPQYPAHAQMHPQQQMFMGRGGPAGAQYPPGQWPKQPGAPLMNGNPIQKFPPGGQWRLLESHLSEPLNPSHRSRSANSPPQPQPQPQEQPSYSAYDKETGPAPMPSGSSSSQRVQTRPRNTSVPPSSAQRWPGLFNHVHEQHPPPSQPPGHHQHPLLRGQYNEDSTNGAKGSFELRSSKDMGVRVDEVSISSVASEEASENHRRGSGSIFDRVTRRNTGDQGTPQVAQFGAPDKKRNFFDTITGHSQPQPKSNSGLARTTTQDRYDTASNQSTGDPAPVKKRLSELKGMIKGVGNAKEGAREASRDDHAGKPNTAHAPGHLMQGPFRGPPGLSGAPGPLPQPGQSGHMIYQRSQGPQAPTGQAAQAAQAGPIAPPSVGIGRINTGDSHPPQMPQVQSEEGGKRGSGGGFLGGLFNKQANKPKEPMPQSNSPASPPSQHPMQFAPMQHGQPFRPPPQTLGPHPMYAGTQGPVGQLSAQRSMTPDQLSPQVGEPLSPHFVQTAQAVMIRRPSEITVSQTQPANAQALSPPRVNMSSQQGSQAPVRLSPGPSPLGSAQSQQTEADDDDDDDSVLKDSPRLSQESFQEHLNVGSPSSIPRAAPNRKPVGSGTSKQDEPYMTSAQPPSKLHERSLSEQSPQLSASNWQGHMRQPSLPSSSNSPVPSQHDLSGSPRPQGSGPSTERQGSTERLGVAYNPSGQPGISAGPGPQQNAPIWGSKSGPQFTSIQPPRLPASPAPSMDQSKLSKFFGAYDGGKAPAHPHAHKDKSAASKFFSAFKRSSKQNESSPPQQQRSTPKQQAPPHMMRPGIPSQPGQSGQTSQAGQQLKQPVQPGQPIQPRQPGQFGQPGLQEGPQQPGIPRPAINGPTPPGPLGTLPTQGQGPSPGPGRGPILAPQIQGPFRNQGPNKLGEPQYDQVPIPRGYEAVHGYGHDRILVSPSPYNVGRPSFPPPQFLQHQPMQRQPIPPQQWDARVMPPPQPGTSYTHAPVTSQTVSQGIMPQSGQSPPQQPQVQPSSQNASPGQQGSPLHVSQIPAHQQLIPLSPNHQLNQSSITEQEHVQSQLAQNPAAQESHAEPHSSRHRSHSPAAQTPSSSNWGSVPESSNSPASLRRHEPVLRTQASQPNYSSLHTSGPSSNDDSRGSQAQHIATAISHQHVHPQALQSDPAQVDIPAHEPRRTPPHLQEEGSPTLHPPSAEAGQGELQTASGPRDASPSTDATRLTSRMSITNEPPRSSSLSPEVTSDRALSVSPEPRHQRLVPVHQVSEPSMNVNIDRANEFRKDSDDDIYDATPRMNNAHPQEDHMHENTKYAGSEKGRVITNGVTVTGAGAIFGAAAGGNSSASFLSGPEDSDPEDITPQREQKITLNMEPEEKILVDQPVELAAVNDDDDGIPMMSATSYPGQEWNPYGAGEFGDWD